MVTRRNFLVIFLMMFILFFLFEFSQVMKEFGNDYNNNSYSKEMKYNSGDVWRSDRQDYKAAVIGDASSNIYKMVYDWCTYTKRGFLAYPSVTECAKKSIYNVLILEGNYVKDEEIDILDKLADQGVTIIFASMPDVSRIKANEKWMKLLGIKEVHAEKQQLTGVDLFGGFLLGGEAIYKAKDAAEEKERQDLELEIPWYYTGDGCKTYMVGYVADKRVKNEQLPAIVWRVSNNRRRIFVMNGSYMQDESGLGFLNAMIAESQDYYIYPVINSQSMCMVNFPGIASENSDKMVSLYSREQKAVFRDVLWPSLWSITQKSDAKMTCLMSPQFDYTDSVEPGKDELIFYLKQMKEQGGEAGQTMDCIKLKDYKDKFKRDKKYYDSEGCKYQFRCMYVPNNTVKDFLANRNDSMIKDTSTIASEFVEDNKYQTVARYIDKNTTMQLGTSTGIKHTYRDDIRMKALETSLGYANILMDMKQITWPKKKDDRWEIVSEKFSSNVNTFWQPFEAFDQTTLSQGDERIRNLLALNYTAIKQNDEIDLNITNRNGVAYFILRMNNDTLKDVKGGEFEEIEDGAYLIKATSDKVKLDTYVTDKLYYVLE